MAYYSKKDFSQPASDGQIERTARALEANGFNTLIAENGEQARRLFFELVPEGAQVFQGHSATLEELGITAEIEKSGDLWPCARNCAPSTARPRPTRSAA